MIFIHPMWDSEGQRLGMKACTRTGYAIRVLADLIGFTGLILLVLVPCLLAIRFLHHQFSTRDLWLLLAPLIVGVIGRVLFEFGWSLAAKKKYQYDYKTMTVTWIEDGHEKFYEYKR